MVEKPCAERALGLQLTSDYLRGVTLSFKSGRPELVRVFKIPLEKESQDVKPLYIEKQEAFLKEILDKELVLTAIDSSSLLVRELSLQVIKAVDIEATLGFQLEPYLPFPLEDALLDYQVLDKKSDGVEVICFSATKKAISDHLTKWHSLSVEPEVVSCLPAALAQFSFYFFDKVDANLVLYFGSEETCCMLVKKGCVLGSHAFNADFEGLFGEAIETDSLEEKLHGWRLGVLRVVFSLQKQTDENVEQLLLVGEGAGIEKIEAFLEEKLRLRVLKPLEKEGVDIPPDELCNYAVSLGLALSGCDSKLSQVNFRQEALAFPNPWKRLKKPLITYFSFVLALVCAMFLFTVSYVEKRTSRLQQSYIELDAAVMRFFGGRAMGVKPDDLQELSEAINGLEKKIQTYPEAYALFPNTPRAVDVLAWLSGLSLVTDLEADGVPNIEIQSFSYKMVKRPEPSKPKQRYQVRVDIEFKAKTPRFARELHDLILAPNPYIDPKGDVKWTTERDLHRASFYLQDKTFYPK